MNEYIYKIIDNTNDNCYIGKTKNINHRMRQHRYSHRHQKQCCSSEQILKNEDWYYEIIEMTNNPIEREKYWINNSKNCINKLTYKFTYESKRKEYYKIKYQWQKSWGDNLSNNKYSIYSNNLLCISPDLFLV
tara:strand:- start:570 stop:968 length:399 start_codon:yes stop_codon:yes gene_type:complete